MDPLFAARKHAKSFARDMSKCSRHYIVQIALKELRIPSTQDGFQLAKHVILLLWENRFHKLQNDAYTVAGNHAVPPMSDEQVYQAINRVVRHAWENRNMKIWKCYFRRVHGDMRNVPQKRNSYLPLWTLWSCGRAAVRRSIMWDNELMLQRNLADLSVTQLRTMLNAEVQKDVPDDDLVLAILHILEERDPVAMEGESDQEKEAWGLFRKRI